jgi:formate hydrogenlyase subunit 6/NADH:ubiquinone oxidoreductase subunit I
MGSEYEMAYEDRADAIIDREALLLKPEKGANATPQKTKPGEFNRPIPEMEDPK